MKEIKKNGLSNKIIFILALIFMGLRINIIGNISITEIFVLLYSPYLFYEYRKTKIPYLKVLCSLFIALIIVQILSEYFIGNTLTNAMKGIAGTIMALLLFLFFFEKLCKDVSLIKWIPIVGIIRLILFGDQFGFSETGEDTYFKFYLAPIISFVVCYLSLSKVKLIKKFILLIFLAASLIIIIGGARSSGFSLLFSTLLCFIYEKYNTFSLKRIFPLLIVVIVAFQLFYAFLYVPKVASGEWGSKQNQEQLARIGNSRNVFLMLFSARADFYVSYLAFCDKPLWGHGAWAKDKGLKYAKIQAQLFSKDETSKTNINKGIEHWVPMHSVVMGMGTRNGIFAFLIFLVIFILMYYIGIKALLPKAPYNIFLIYMLVSSFQHLLFGPISILKNNGSLAFALFFTLYCLKTVYLKKNENEIRTISSNCNI